MSHREHPIKFSIEMAAAHTDSGIFMDRRPVTEENSIVWGGRFSGVDLETGRARRAATARPGQGPEIRARHTSRSGRVRAVKIEPIVRAGDLLWIRTRANGSRRSSSQTLVVQEVDVARLQDMSDDDALRDGFQGFMLAPETMGPIRKQYAELWDMTYGPWSWASNPWVWIYRYAVHRQNIDEYLAAREASP